MIVFLCLLAAFFAIGMLGSKKESELGLYLVAFVFTVIAVFVYEYASFFWG